MGRKAEKGAPAASSFEDLTPREIVRRLDEYIIGQDAAKRAVAVAIRNRLRRLRVADDLRDEIIPKNLILIGPTGVGKTEIARRIATLLQAPFIKVEATKFTEVGYVGRDVDSIIRELTENAVRLVRSERLDAIQDTLIGRVVDKLVDTLQPLPVRPGGRKPPRNVAGEEPADREKRLEAERQKQAKDDEQFEQVQRIRTKLRERVRKGEMDDELITIETTQQGQKMMQVFTSQGLEELGMDLQNMLEGMNERPRKKRRITVGEARRLLLQEEADKAIDMDAVVREAIERCEIGGIVFLDEVDKIAHREHEGGHGGPDVSREGVQRDILPLVEGTTVVTKYGPVRTQHILFIAAGAFHVSKVSDLIPELQGRFPLRVELEALSESDFARILREPKNSLLKQYTALLAADGVELEFAEDAIEAMAHIATGANRAAQNIGARRLHTVIEKLLEDISFAAPYEGAPAAEVAAMDKTNGIPSEDEAADALDTKSIRTVQDDRGGSGPADDSAVGGGEAEPKQPGVQPTTRIVIDAAFVEQKLGELAREKDVAEYIL
jgi:ATP-dependent HslUV protease ATP-binding subunit HslU